MHWCRFSMYLDMCACVCGTFCILSIYFQPNFCKHDFITRTVSRLQHRSIKPNPLTAKTPSLWVLYLWNGIVFKHRQYQLMTSLRKKFLSPAECQMLIDMLLGKFSAQQIAVRLRCIEKNKWIAWGVSTDTLFNQVFGSVRRKTWLLKGYLSDTDECWGPWQWELPWRMRRR